MYRFSETKRNYEKETEKAKSKKIIEMFLIEKSETSSLYTTFPSSISEIMACLCTLSDARKHQNIMKKDAQG